MPRVEDVTDYVVQDSGRGPGDARARVARAKPAKALTPTLQATLDEWLRGDRSLGYVAGALAYGFRSMRPSTHTNMVRLVKGGHLRVCRVFAPPPPGSNAKHGSPFGDSYYLVRPDCPAEVAEGALQGARRRRRRRRR